MTQHQDLFTFSFGKSPFTAKHYGDNLTAAQVLAEITDLLVNPANSEIAYLHVRRTLRTLKATGPITLELPSLANGNGHAGWSVQVLDASRYDKRGFFTNRHEVLAEKLVEVLINRGTEVLTIDW